MKRRRAKLQVYRDRTGQYRWRLRAVNGEIVATGEAYPRARDARAAFWTVVRIVTEGVAVAGIPRRRA
jgi:uncharacterized protein YegP (UPF0339 family)